MLTYVTLAINQQVGQKYVKCKMESLIKLFNDWEIQLLLLLSFALQIFLFFTGGLRWHGTKMLLRFSIWLAYLGADLVAVYALGYLSRHMDSTTGRNTLTGTHPLAFFWAPFLLVHLGGQDTITAFAMEDNSLWLRHLLNMVVQVVIALYVFWKSIEKHSMKLLVSGIFVFVVGVIKYGERIWSLKCGSLDSLESSTRNQYNYYRLQELPHSAYDDRIVRTALCLMPNVYNVFTQRSLNIEVSDMAPDAVNSLVDIELGILYDDIYTKSLVMRTRRGIILRCISQIAALVAFRMFVAGDRQGYNAIDMKSPCTWAWFKARGFDLLARCSWCLFSNEAIGWKRQWSPVMGQYNLRDWLVHNEKPRSFGQNLMIMVKKFVISVGSEEKKLFWLSKLVFKEYSKTDETMKHFQTALYIPSLDFTLFAQIHHLRPLLRDTEDYDFGFMIVSLHMFTEQHMCKHYLQGDAIPGHTDSRVLVCLQLSRYIMYLLVNHPSLLPLSKSAVATMEAWQAAVAQDDFMTTLERLDPPATTQTLEECLSSWTWVIFYAAGKSRGEMHAALLARGGELLTSVWLVLAHLQSPRESSSLLSWYRDIDRSDMFTGDSLRIGSGGLDGAKNNIGPLTDFQ
ncbi:hypothetical protein ACP70R_003330 [Stipagrostis hirtigluma subsp. patula]